MRLLSSAFWPRSLRHALSLGQDYKLFNSETLVRIENFLTRTFPAPVTVYTLSYCCGLAASLFTISKVCRSLGFYWSDPIRAILEVVRVSKLLWMNFLKTHVTPRYLALLMRNARDLTNQNVVKHMFAAHPVSPINTPRNHPHPESAAVRNRSRLFIDAFCRSVGKQQYVYQRTENDVNNDRLGSHEFNTAKDFNVDYAAFDPPLQSIVSMVDTDYYADMPKLLAQFPRTYILSTFQPTSVSGIIDNLSFTFDSEDNLHCGFAGGATYVHKVWNYAHDIIVATRFDWARLSYACVSYSVDRKYVTENHQIILLSPLVSFHSPLIDVMRWCGGNVLNRLRVNFNGFLRLDTKTRLGHMRSTGLPGTYASATITAVQDDALFTKQTFSRNDLTTHYVKSFTHCTDEAAEVLVAYFRKRPLWYGPDVVYPMDNSASYQALNQDYDENAKPSMVPFMHPIVRCGYAPVHSRANDRRMVEARINSIKTDISEIPFRYYGYMHEFLSIVFPTDVKHTLIPKSMEYVLLKQARPSQRASIARAVAALPEDYHDIIRSFMKSEAYTKPADPRVISTIPDLLKLHYSQIIYSFTEYLTNNPRCPWYAFGRTPRQIAQRVSDYCRTLKRSATQTDYSRWDGRMSFVLRVFEAMALYYAFMQLYHDMIRAQTPHLIKQKAVTRFGIPVDTDDTRLSGSPDTAVMNSFDNAFISFCTYRDCGLPGQEAYDKLGVYGGDDGITGDVDEQVFTRVAADFGHVIEIENVPVGKPGISFLSRMYSRDVWFGDVNSMCDLKRMLSKLHLSQPLDPKVTPHMKLGQKINNLFYTDLYTPIIGDIVKVVKTRYSEIVPTADRAAEQDMRPLASYNFLTYEESEQYPNSRDDWMFDLAEQQLPGFRWTLMDSWIDNLLNERISKATRMNILLSPPLCYEEEPRPTFSVAFGDGEHIIVPEPTPDPRPRQRVPRGPNNTPEHRPLFAYPDFTASSGTLVNANIVANSLLPASTGQRRVNCRSCRSGTCTRHVRRNPVASGPGIPRNNTLPSRL